ncbi:MAG: hypothetical protein AB1607_04835 [Chloroflexota bacterium]
MANKIEIGDRVQVFLRSDFWKSDGGYEAPGRQWFDGVVVRIDPYSEHRSFIWVELDEEADGADGRGRLISVLNPKNIRKV